MSPTAKQVLNFTHDVYLPCIVQFSNTETEYGRRKLSFWLERNCRVGVHLSSGRSRSSLGYGMVYPKDRADFQTTQAVRQIEHLRNTLKGFANECVVERLLNVRHVICKVHLLGLVRTFTIFACSSFSFSVLDRNICIDHVRHGWCDCRSCPKSWTLFDDFKKWHKAICLRFAQQRLWMWPHHF